MASYTPDYKYQEAKKVIDEMKGKKGELVRYYISQNKKWYDCLLEKNEQMRITFKAIASFGR